MADKLKLKKKLIVKKKVSGGTIADKIKKQQSAKENQNLERKILAKKPQGIPKNQEIKPVVANLPSAKQSKTTFLIDQKRDSNSAWASRNNTTSRKKKSKENLREDNVRKEDKQKYLLKNKGLEKEKKKFSTPSIPKEIKITEYIQVGELARKLNIRAPEVISRLMKMGVMATITQSIDSDTVTILAGELGCKVKVISLYDETVIQEEEDKVENLKFRTPIVTIMGHVDHGKTRLLDALRSTNVVASEAGGITQHIGAYQVEHPRGKITFLDTPGHAAFTAMRARGAHITDVVILVVAADDGVMPQTKEAISHAKDAKVPIVVAINKIDKPEANVEKIKQEVSQFDLVPEDWGGSTPFVEVSALKKQGLEKLEEVILAQAEIMELKADPSKRAVGTVIEAKLDQGRGPVATILIQGGTLKQGQAFVVGLEGGRVRAIVNDRGQKIKEAPPSTPVEILGLSGVPSAGDTFYVMKTEKEAKAILEKRQELNRQQQTQKIKKVKLENLSDFIADGKIQEIKIIIKADVHGSVEALENSFKELSNDEIRINVIMSGTGEISESDVMLCSAANALIIGFNTRANSKVKEVASKEGVEIRFYNIIYEAIEDMKEAMSGLLSPEISEETIGEVEVRQLFKISNVGTIAGCMVTSGIIRRNNPIKLIREGKQIYEGKLESLKRFQEDINEVKEGFECGILIKNYNDLKMGDLIESIESKETARSLDDLKSENE